MSFCCAKYEAKRQPRPKFFDAQETREIAKGAGFM
jgi:hypothetical protein